MSFRSLGKLFKTKNCIDKRDSKRVVLPAEGFDRSRKMLLAYSGQDITETAEAGAEIREGFFENSSCCHLHSVAVLRCLGRSQALAGADPFEDLEIDKMVNILIDLLYKIQALDSKKVEPVTAKFDREVALGCLYKLNAVVGTSGGHLVLNKLTWADFLLAGMWEHVKRSLCLADSSYLHIEALVEQLTTMPNIEAALERDQKPTT